MTIQDIRNLMRPFLTVLFSSAFVAMVVIAIIRINNLAFDQAVALIGLVGTPTGTIIGYHFGKKSSIDEGG